MIQALEEFYVRKVQDNLALVEYPHLSGWTEVDLNLCANDLLQLGGLVLNVNIFVNNHPIQIIDMGLGGHGEDYHIEEHIPHHEHDGIIEGPPSGDRLYEHHDWMDHHELWHQTTGTITEQIHEVEEAIHKFEQQLHDLHDESDHYVEKYHSTHDAIEQEWHHRYEELEREFLARYQELEHQYTEDMHHMQD